MLKFIKIHWFGLIVSLLGLAFLVFFILVAVSPRQDKFDRGFIPCTKNMMQQMLRCPADQKAWCMTKAVTQSTWCNAQVISAGFKAWLHDEQPAPWSNYLFEPELLTPNTSAADPELVEFYEQNQNLAEEMQVLDVARLVLEEENDNEKAKSEE